MPLPYPSRFFPPKGAPKPSARQSVLAQWRGVDVAPLEKEKRPSEKPIGSIMTNVLSHLRMDQRHAEAEIGRAWNHLIDSNITAHAQPVGLNKQGTLFVNVDSNVWLDEIVRFRRKEILLRLQHCFGKDRVKKISFRLG